MDIYRQLEDLGLIVPKAPPRGGLYKPVKQSGNLLYVSGQGPIEGGKPIIRGKVGRERTVEEGRLAARLCVLNALACLEEYLGDLNKIKSVVKILAFVASDDGFNEQPKVIDGASQLLSDLFGEDHGVGARSAIGVSELPGDITVEIEFIVEI